MLHAAGLTQSDPALAQLFRVTRVSPLVMEQLSEVISIPALSGVLNLPATSSASYELLAGIAQRNKKSFCTGFGTMERIMVQKLETLKTAVFSHGIFGDKLELHLSQLEQSPGKSPLILPFAFAC